MNLTIWDQVEEVFVLLQEEQHGSGGCHWGSLGDELRSERAEKNGDVCNMLSW